MAYTGKFLVNNEPLSPLIIFWHRHVRRLLGRPAIPQSGRLHGGARQGADSHR
ncbi:hypothetical protein QF000_006218 [Paraburkholderia atlantica]